MAIAALRVTARLGGKLWVHEIRKPTSSGHQTAVIATDYRADPGPMAAAMFARWSQESKKANASSAISIRSTEPSPSQVQRGMVKRPAQPGTACVVPPQRGRGKSPQKGRDVNRRNRYRIVTQGKFVTQGKGEKNPVAHTDRNRTRISSISSRNR